MSGEHTPLERELLEALEAVLTADEVTGGEVLSTRLEEIVRTAIQKARG